MPLLALNPELPVTELQAKFSEKRRLQISDFLTRESAEALKAALEKREWNLVLNDRERHIDLPKSEFAKIGLSRMQAAIKQAQGRAASEFQYIYENIPIADAVQSGRLNDDVLKAAYELMNSDEVIAALRTITGLDIDFCDMQGTKYGPGHMLTPHDDAVAGKNRKFAYVLGMTRDWSAVWGGQLQFLTEQGDVLESFVPKFNTLSIFEVPILHHVTQVANFAPRARISCTGWYRTKT